MPDYLKVLILILTSINTFGQVDKGTLFGFIEGSFKTHSSEQTEKTGYSFENVYTTKENNTTYYGETGVSYTFSKKFSASISVSIDNSKNTTEIKSVRNTFITTVRDFNDTIVKHITDASRMKNTTTENSLALNPGFSYYINLHPKITLFINAGAVFKRRSYSFESFNSGGKGPVANTFNSRNSWSMGFNLNPAVLTKIYRRFYIYYAPLNIFYLKSLDDKDERQTKISTDLNLITLGVFYRMNGKNQ